MNKLKLKIDCALQVATILAGCGCCCAFAQDGTVGSPTLRPDVEAACAYAAEIPPDQVRNYTIRSGVIDIDGDGSFENIKGVTAMGTMRGDDFEITDSQGQIVKWSEVDIQHGDQLLLGARWLPFRGRAYLLGFEDEQAGFLVRLSFPDLNRDLHFGCWFETKVEEIFLADAEIYSDICESVKKGEAPEIKPIAANERSIVGRWTWSRGSIDLDVKNDGHEVSLQWLNYSSGAGRGCEATFYDTTDAVERGIDDSTHQQLLEAQHVSLDMKDKDYGPLECGALERRWLKFEGKNYLETRYPGDTPHGDSQMIHRLQTFESGRLKTVCNALFSRSWSRTVDKSDE